MNDDMMNRGHLGVVGTLASNAQIQLQPALTDEREKEDMPDTYNTC